ncbi:MAG: hypothetical protein FWG34_10215 [Oscillospiraceae bacterium]|nr:hypothetical protein [Oscillospiraceae bacterium]
MQKKHILALILIAASMIGICGCMGKKYFQISIKESALEYMEQKYGEEFTYIDTLYSGSNFDIRLKGITVSCDTFPDKEIFVSIRQGDKVLEYGDNYMDYYFAPQVEDYILGIAKNYFEDIVFELKILDSHATDNFNLTSTFEEYISNKYFYVDGQMEISASNEKTIRKFTNDLLEREIYFSLYIKIPSLDEAYNAYYYRYNDEFLFYRRK